MFQQVPREGWSEPVRVDEDGRFRDKLFAFHAGRRRRICLPARHGSIYQQLSPESRFNEVNTSFCLVVVSPSIDLAERIESTTFETPSLRNKCVDWYLLLAHFIFSFDARKVTSKNEAIAGKREFMVNFACMSRCASPLQECTAEAVVCARGEFLGGSITKSASLSIWWKLTDTDHRDHQNWWIFFTIFKKIAKNLSILIVPVSFY